MKYPPTSKSKFKKLFLKSHGNNNILRKQTATKWEFINQLLQHISGIALQADITVLDTTVLETKKPYQETLLDIISSAINDNITLESDLTLTRQDFLKVEFFWRKSI